MPKTCRVLDEGVGGRERRSDFGWHCEIDGKQVFLATLQIARGFQMPPDGTRGAIVLTAAAAQSPASVARDAARDVQDPSPPVASIANRDALVLCTPCEALAPSDRKGRRDQVMVRMLDDAMPNGVAAATPTADGGRSR